MRARLITPASSEWPRALADLTDVPSRIHLAGHLPDPDRSVAIVGTRRSDEAAEQLAFALGRDLARSGWAVVSGGALGIDAAAHEGALEGGGATVAVLATGLGRPYPRRHGPLFRRIAETGAVLSENPPDTAARPGQFLARNRIIAALSRAVVVVQAPVRSGALSTARHAAALRRSVLAVPHAPWDPRGGGCVALLRDGARVCAGLEDVLSVADPGASSTAGPVSDDEANFPSGLDEDGRRLFGALGVRAKHVDDLVAEAGLDAARAQRALLELVLHGLAEERGEGRWMRARGR